MTKHLIILLISSCIVLHAKDPIDFENLDPMLKQRLIELLQNPQRSAPEQQQPAPYQQPATKYYQPVQTNAQNNNFYNNQNPSQPNCQDGNNEEVEMICNLAANIVCAAITKDSSKLNNIIPSAIGLIIKKKTGKRGVSIDGESDAEQTTADEVTEQTPEQIL